ncbi:caspase family protein [Lentzea sp. NPDC092896]|uniref:caspase family protein n=1 Tax=Lentzea sp. NPDC092896 TaxID=3364127 RepID=UPI003805A1AA
MTTFTKQNDLHFAIVVGIDHYPALADLKSARHDAAQFYDWLVDPAFGAVPPANVITVQASDPVMSIDSVLPTQKQIINAMHHVQCTVRQAVTTDPEAFSRTRLYVFVAGHGITPSDGAGGALLTADATPQLGYHVDLRKYARWHRKNGLFREVFVFADCCRVASNVPYGFVPPFTNEPSGMSTDAVVAYATTAGGSSIAQMSGSGARGHFTRALLEALRGAAVNESNDITLASIENYVGLCLGQDQVADFHPKKTASVVLSLRPPAREVRFVFPRPFYGVVQVFRGDDTGTTHPVAGNHLALTLRPGLYRREGRRRTPAADRTGRASSRPGRASGPVPPHGGQPARSAGQQGRREPRSGPRKR